MSAFDLVVIHPFNEATEVSFDIITKPRKCLGLFACSLHTEMRDGGLILSVLFMQRMCFRWKSFEKQLLSHRPQSIVLYQRTSDNPLRVCK